MPKQNALNATKHDTIEQIRQLVSTSFYGIRPWSVERYINSLPLSRSASNLFWMIWDRCYIARSTETSIPALEAEQHLGVHRSTLYEAYNRLEELKLIVRQERWNPQDATKRIPSKVILNFEVSEIAELAEAPTCQRSPQPVGNSWVGDTQKLSRDNEHNGQTSSVDNEQENEVTRCEGKPESILIESAEEKALPVDEPHRVRSSTRNTPKKNKIHGDSVTRPDICNAANQSNEPSQSVLDNHTCTQQMMSPPAPLLPKAVTKTPQGRDQEKGDSLPANRQAVVKDLRLQLLRIDGDIRSLKLMIEVNNSASYTNSTDEQANALSPALSALNQQLDELNAKRQNLLIQLCDAKKTTQDQVIQPAETRSNLCQQKVIADSEQSYLNARLNQINAVVSQPASLLEEIKFSVLQGVLSHLPVRHAINIAIKLVRQNRWRTPWGYA